MTASLPSMTTGGGGDTLTTSGQRGATGTYSLSFVLVVAIISFLLGSLLRSLLTRECPGTPAVLMRQARVLI